MNKGKRGGDLGEIGKIGNKARQGNGRGRDLGGRGGNGTSDSGWNWRERLVLLKRGKRPRSGLR